MKILHVYGQKVWHDTVTITGPRTSLETLVTALNCALVTGETIEIKNAFMTNDGEGFNLIIDPLSFDDKMEDLKLPYFDKEMTGQGE